MSTAAFVVAQVKDPVPTLKTIQIHLHVNVQFLILTVYDWRIHCMETHPKYKQPYEKHCPNFSYFSDIMPL